MTIEIRSVLGCVLSLGLIMVSSAAVAQLAGSEWRPTEIGEITVTADSEIFVRFGGDGKLEGHGGCNRFFGSYSLEGDKIEMGPLGATQMACPEPVMETEIQFLQTLQDTRHFVRDQRDLTLSDDSKNPLLRLTQTDAD